VCKSYMTSLMSVAMSYRLRQSIAYCVHESGLNEQ
jgi:hypothetical protein